MSKALDATVLICLALCWALIAAVHKRVARPDRAFALAVLFSAIAVKVVIMTAYFHLWLLPGNRDVIGPDGEGFSQRGWYIARVLAGKPDYTVPSSEFVYHGFYRVVDYYKRRLPPFNSRANGLNTYAIGLAYFLFGYKPLLIKMVNIFISAFSAVFIYLAASELYGLRKAPRLALLLFTFFPSIFIFSISALREPLILLCLSAVVYLLMRLRNGMTSRRLALMVFSLGLLLFLREELFLIVMAAAGMTFLITPGQRYRIVLIPAMIIAVAAAVNSPVFRRIHTTERLTPDNIASRIFLRNAGLYAEGGRLAYMAFPERYYLRYKKYKSDKEYLDSKERFAFGDLVRCLPSGMASYITRPFPFSRRGFIDDLLSAHMIWWYIICAMALVGILNTPPAGAYPVYIYICLMLLITPLADANEGILLRHRDMIAPFFIIFAARGFDRLTAFMKGVRS